MSDSLTGTDAVLAGPPGRRVTGAARAAAACVALAAVVAPQRPAPVMTEVGRGIYLFQTAPYGDVGLDGNAIAITSPDGVLIFDSNGTPSASAGVLAGVRRITHAPVRYVVNSHWHWDHWYGTETYASQFPGLKVIAQTATRRMMLGPAIAFNQPGLESQLPDYIRVRDQKAADARAATPPAADAAALEQLAADDRFFLQQKLAATHVIPDVTFEHEMDLSLGGRRIQLRHVEPAVTPGDTFLYLPDDKVLVTGDLLVNPVSFALSCYPTGWLRTLERLDGLDAAVIVPGHGAALHDKALLHDTMATFRILLDAGRSARARGLDPDQARAEALPRLHDLMVRITGNDQGVNDAFRVQLVDWYLHRVFDELAGPLTDAIAPIPAS